MLTTTRSPPSHWLSLQWVRRWRMVFLWYGNNITMAKGLLTCHLTSVGCVSSNSLSCFPLSSRLAFRWLISLLLFGWDPIFPRMELFFLSDGYLLVRDRFLVEITRSRFIQIQILIKSPRSQSSGSPSPASCLITATCPADNWACGGQFDSWFHNIGIVNLGLLEG